MLLGFDFGFGLELGLGFGPELGVLMPGQSRLIVMLSKWWNKGKKRTTVSHR